MTVTEIIALGVAAGGALGGGVVGLLKIPAVVTFLADHREVKRTHAASLTEEIRAHSDTRERLGKRAAEGDKRVAVLEARVAELEHVNRNHAAALQHVESDREKSRIDMKKRHGQEMDALTFALRRVLEESEKETK